MGKKKNPAQPVIDESKKRYETTRGPSELEQEFTPFRQNMMGNYGPAVERNNADYGNIMGAYQQFREGLSPTTFGYNKVGFDRVKAERPKELGEGYGYLREAMPGYRDFAKTGGYSDTDVQEMRARGISPIRAAYGNTMMELDRARSLGGGGGAPNYIAALSRAQRELPEQLASATTDVNARLADSIRQGRMFGLQGITGTGSTMGGLASQEANRMLQAGMANQDAGLRAALANQEADLRAQGMNEASIQNMRQSALASIGGQANLYGTTPGMSNMFGNQALNSMQQQAGMEQMRNQFGMDLLNSQMRGYAMQPQGSRFGDIMRGIGQIAPYAMAPFTGGMSLMGAGMGPFSSFGSGANAAMQGQAYNQGPLMWGQGGFQ